MAKKTIACPNCKECVQVTLGGTQHRCICGCVISYSAAAETQRETSSRSRGDRKGEHHSLQRRLKCFQTKKSSYNNSFSTSSSSGNSFKPSYTGTGTPMLLPSSGLVRPVPGGSRPNKRALLCGVTYKHHRKYKLKHTRNDVINILIDTFGFPANCIRVLSEDDPRALERIPTKKNIDNSLKWLVEGCQWGDSLVFYFSGHGLRQPDLKDDELDGFDETICPVDFMKEGMILDNNINETIVRPLEEGVTLHAIVDSSHSGTILDLAYGYNRKQNAGKDNSPPSRVRKSTNGGVRSLLDAGFESINSLLAC